VKFGKERIRNILHIRYEILFAGQQLETGDNKKL
jgi:hypothetical protein